MKYFVYRHLLDGVVFYVGYGAVRPPKKDCHSFKVKYERAYLRFGRNSQLWLDFVGSRLKDVVVEIIKHFDKRKEAMDYEMDMIDLYKESIINVVGTRPIYQFSVDGFLIKKFHLISEASKETGTDSSSISNVLLGNRVSAGGFLWSTSQVIDVPVFYCDKIIQKDFNGNVIAKYKTIAAAVLAMKKTTQTAIRNCFTGRQKKAYGYCWEKIEHEPDMAKEKGLSKSRLNKYLL